MSKTLNIRLALMVEALLNSNLSAHTKAEITEINNAEPFATGKQVDSYKAKLAKKASKVKPEKVKKPKAEKKAEKAGKKVKKAAKKQAKVTKKLLKKAAKHDSE